ncbi:MAG: hypothetical protein MJZ19_08610 [Paludibacteraceae bacterium]|nr:hypothetical protein [Paludibacteraceae bacterium]
MFRYKEDKKIDPYAQINIVTQIHNIGLPIDDPFWYKNRPGDQWNCKCWLEQTDAPRTALEDMPDSADIPEPKAGLRGNTAKTKEIFSHDLLQLTPNAHCQTCLMTD